MAPPFPNLLITVNATDLEKISLSDIQIFKTFVTILTPDDKYSLLNRDNLRQPIHMKLSQKEKRFAQFVSAF